jgi:hypothetical protein
LAKHPRRFPRRQGAGDQVYPIFAETSMVRQKRFDTDPIDREVVFEVRR